MKPLLYVEGGELATSCIATGDIVSTVDAKVHNAWDFGTDGSMWLPSTNLTPTQGAIAVRFVAAASGVLLDVGGVSQNRLVVAGTPTGISVSWSFQNITRTLSLTATVGDVVTLYISWIGTKLTISNGTTENSLSTRASSNALWGDAVYGTTWSEPVGDLLLFAQPLTPTQQTKLYATDSWSNSLFVARIGGLIKVHTSTQLGVMRTSFDPI